jgi:tripartite-type tricarboxylate transporter receptor subunit TctC
MKHWALLAAACAASLVVAANADTFPSKQITMVLPFGAGSGTDTIAG